VERNKSAHTSTRECVTMQHTTHQMCGATRRTIPNFDREKFRKSIVGSTYALELIPESIRADPIYGGDDA
jgi:hypothetical protein